MARGQVLLKWQPVDKVAVARDGANPILLVEPFRLKVHRQKAVINVENKIKLPVFYEFCDAAPPGPEFKMDLIAYKMVSCCLRLYTLSGIAMHFPFILYIPFIVLR